MTDRLEVLGDVAAGFDSHDLDRLVRRFTNDAIFESPHGPGKIRAT